MESTPKYVDEKVAAGVTGFCVQTLRNQRSAGRGIPYYKVGKSVKYKLDDVVEFMERHKVVPDEA